MRDFDRRSEEDSSAPRADGEAKVDVLQVHEVALVEKADRVRIIPSNEQARAGDPVGIALAPGERIHVAHRSQLALDVLAQQVVAVCAGAEQTVDGLFALVRRAAPFAKLPQVALYFAA